MEWLLYNIIRKTLRQVIITIFCVIKFTCSIFMLGIHIQF